MKKILSKMLAILILLMITGCSKTETEKNDLPTASNAGITILVPEEAIELTQKQVEAFKSANPEVTIDIAVQGQNSAYIASQIESFADGACLYMFAQDQLSRFVSAGLLTEIDDQSATEIENANGSLAVSAASLNGKLYAYPITSDNGYFMYYDKNVINEDEIDDLATLIKACETADKLFCMRYDDDSAWYNASFFIGTGCVSEWETDENGNFISYTDSFNSEAGVKALKGLKIIADSPIAYSAARALNFSKDAAVVISGAWDAEAVKDILGKYMGVADLPSFTVDGETYHMGSFAGYKLLGVKPQTDLEKEAICQELAAYLSSEICQLERYEELGWGPTNNNALANENVKADAVLMALEEQSKYAIPQGQYPSEWWEIAAGFGSAAKHAKTDADLEEALKIYADSIKGICK